MQATGSISRGKLATKHNLRTCYDGHNCPSNIDLSRSAENEVLVSRDIADVYAEAFGEALAAYNASQVEKRHPERQIPDYLEHVRADKKLNEAYEFVVQVGNIDERPPEALCAAILRDFESEFEKEHGERFRVIQAVIHMDEATPHMHMQVVPVAESKRGLAVQNSLNKAIEQSGFDDYKVMLMGWDETLTECMEEHGVERVIGDKERQRGGVDIDTYRNAVRVAKNITDAEADMENMRRSVDAEVAAKKAELSEVNRQIEQANERLESVRHDERKAENQNRKLGERVSELEEGIALEKAQPTYQSVAESVGTLVEHRGDGEREASLRGEVEGLRERVADLERMVGDARGKLWAADGRVRKTQESINRLRERLDVAIARVRAALAKISEVSHSCCAETKAMAREMGKKVQPDPYSTPRQVWPLEQSRTTSRSYSRGRGR